jgi:hypothetical protein
MVQVNYDIVGFFVPLGCAAAYFPRALRLAGLLDWVMFVSMTVLTGVSGYCDGLGGHFASVYGFSLVYYLGLPAVSRRAVHAPAAMLAPFMFVSIALPDIYLAYTQGCGDSVTVGGNGWRDGVFLWTFLGLIGYGLTAVIARFSSSYRRKLPFNWKVDLRRHFSLALARGA